MLITFSGLDGAGKSTLIELLKKELEEENRRVVVFHMNKDIGVYAYLRFVRDSILNLFSLQEAEKAKPSSGVSNKVDRGKIKGAALILRKRIVWNKFLRRWIYLVDLFIFLFYRLYIEKVKKHVLIMDRYFYDRLVDVADGRRLTGLRLLKLLTPTPNLSIFLDVTPEESFARKGEFSVEYLKRRQSLYREVLSRDASTVVIPNHEDMNATLRALESVIIERLAAQ